MILGLRTVCYPAPDLEKGKAFYRQVMGIDPYFDEPFYVGFAVHGFELGLVPDAPPGNVGTQVFWGVTDIEAEWQRLLDLGATPHEAIKDVGGDIKTATVLDPFGNILGIIQNPHFEINNVR